MIRQKKKGENSFKSISQRESAEVGHGGEPVWGFSRTQGRRPGIERKKKRELTTKSGAQRFGSSLRKQTSRALGSSIAQD